MNPTKDYLNGLRRLWTRFSEANFIIIPLVQTTFLAFLLLTIARPLWIKQFIDYPISLVIGATAIIIFVLNYLFALWKKVIVLERVWIFLRSTLLLFLFSILFSRMHFSDLIIGPIVINTGVIAIILLTTINFLTLFFIYNSILIPFGLRASLVFLAIFTSFSFIRFLSQYIPTQGLSSNIFLEYIIQNFNPLAWIIFSTIFTALFSARYDKDIFRVPKVNFLITTFLVIFQILFGTYLLSLTNYGMSFLSYWQLTIFAFILWDFYFNYKHKVLKSEADINYKYLRRAISYYALLLSLVVMSPYIISLI